MYEMFIDGFPTFTPSVVDDGPDLWAALLATAIVALAIAMAILAEGLI